LARHGAAAPEQAVDAFVRFAEVGRDGADACKGVTELAAEGLEDLDSGLAQPDARLGVGDRGGLAAVAPVARIAGVHGAGCVEGAERGVQCGDRLVVELPGSLEPLGDVVLG
jgi:hypothetical protein